MWQPGTRQLADQLVGAVEAADAVLKAPEGYEEWLKTLFPGAISGELAYFHHDFWRWFWALQPGVPSRPFVSCWGRSAGKSTNLEIAAIAAGVRKLSRYVIFFSSTQKKADARVQACAAQLEGDIVEQYYPAMGQRMVGKFGAAKGWKREKLMTALPSVIEGVGLDADSRGLRYGDERPIVFLDDIDEEHDSARTTQKKLDTISKAILPMTGNAPIVIFVQNLVKRDGVMDQVIQGTAGILSDAIISGPIPLVEDMEVERRADNRYVITGGRSTWPEVQPLEVCEDKLNKMGLRAFDAEMNHQVDEVEGALWAKKVLDDYRGKLFPAPGRAANEPLHGEGERWFVWDKANEMLRPVPDFVWGVVALDPAVSHGPKSDDTGIMVVMAGSDGHYYVVDRQTCHVSPAKWAARTAVAFDRWELDEVVGEVNNGGDLVERNIEAHCDTQDREYLPFRQVRASRNKVTRAQPIANLFEEGRVHLLGHFPELEKQLCTWVPGQESPDDLDAMVWGVWALAFDRPLETAIGGSNLDREDDDV